MLHSVEAVTKERKRSIYALQLPSMNILKEYLACNIFYFTVLSALYGFQLFLIFV